jgi:RNA recognition motif-containing protein
MFEPLGIIVYARIIRDDKTKFSKGYGFVEMATEAEAEHAMKTLDKIYDNKKVRVSQAYNTRQKEAQS